LTEHSAPTSPQGPTDVLYTGGAVLQRSGPKHIFRETASPNVMLAIRVADDHSEVAWTFLDDALSMPGAYTVSSGRAVPAASTLTSIGDQCQPYFYSKICPNLQDLELAEGDDDLATCYSEPLLDTMGASTASVSSFRSLPSNWAPGQSLPELAMNYVRLVKIKDDGSVYTTALAPPPRGRCPAPAVPDEEPDLCSVHQCSIPCSIGGCDGDRRAFLFTF